VEKPAPVPLFLFLFPLLLLPPFLLLLVLVLVMVISGVLVPRASGRFVVMRSLLLLLPLLLRW
jgi:hypothetical protein